MLKSVQKEIHTIKISEIEAQKKAAYTSKEAVYDKAKGELVFVVENAKGKAFRLVHDGKKCFTLVEGSNLTITSSLHIIEEFATEEQALQRIKDLKLEYDPDGIDDNEQKGKIMKG